MSQAALRAVRNAGEFGASTDAETEADADADATTLLGAAASAANASLPPLLMPLTPRRMLRVLSGVHTGAESEMQAERVLVGNLENECDVVLDAGMPERHACLVRASADGWTVLAIAGDLWVGEDYLEAQQTRAITSGLVITLGRVAFCVADPDRIDWATVKPPFNLVKPDPAGELPHAALLPARPASMQMWRTVKLAAGVGIGALVLASAGAYLAQAWAVRKPGAEAEAQKLRADQAMVSALPFGKEVTLLRHPEVPNRVLVQGYVPQRAQIPALQAALQSAETDAELRLAPIDELSADLARRFEGSAPDRIRYDTQGRFVVSSVSESVVTHDRQARRTFQELPAVLGLDLLVNDLHDDKNQPLLVKYLRSTERPGDLVVTNLDAALGRRPFTVQELRLGAMPSVVLDDGLRYFTGAKLPDGGVITGIEPLRLLVTRKGGIESVVSLADVPRIDAPASLLPRVSARPDTARDAPKNQRK